jgi:hypothetical protein
MLILPVSVSISEKIGSPRQSPFDIEEHFERILRSRDWGTRRLTSPLQTHQQQSCSLLETRTVASRRWILNDLDLFLWSLSVKLTVISPIRSMSQSVSSQKRGRGRGLCY